MGLELQLCKLNLFIFKPEQYQTMSYIKQVM